MGRQRTISLLERLEPRTLLSISVNTSPMELLQRLQHRAVLRPIVAATAGPTLNLTAGEEFTGALGFYGSPVIDPPMALSAMINWGDGTTSKAVLQYATHGTTGGYEIVGTHTYANPGTYRVSTVLSLGPLTTAGQPSLGLPTQIVALYVSKAIVNRPIGNSPGGVTIHETAGGTFTENLGTFTAIAPATGLRAIITWGDGSASPGQLIPTSISGLDAINFAVSGTHTYARPGVYPIHIIVTHLTRAATALPISVVATIDSTAIVTQGTSFSLAGMLTGTYTPLPPPLAGLNPLPDWGILYSFTGSGTLAGTGAVKVTGTVRVPGFIASAQAGGTLTLTNGQGTLTLEVTGPSQPGFTAFPDTLSYKVLQGTGAYVGVTAAGTLGVTLVPSATAAGGGHFTFVLT